jgi:membrane fusion protein (multidrug efflux system)
MIDWKRMVFFINAIKYLPSLFPYCMSVDPSNTQQPGQAITKAPPAILSLNQEPTPPKRPKRVVFLSVIASIIFLVGIGGWKAMQISQAIAMGKSFRMPPDAITSLKVWKETVSPILETVGSISSPQGVMLSADLPGIVNTISFVSGSHATNGQLLVQLDTRQEEAQLRTAMAKLDLARQNLERAKDLAQKRVIAQSALDEAKSQHDAALASADETQATIDRKTIRAPFDGYLGIRQINAGQYLKSGDPIVQLESLDPIYVNFALPQQNLARLREGQAVQLKADGIPDKVFKGSINAINSAVDTTTRNVQVQATIPNPEHLLRSGMFAGVQVVLPSRENVIMVPATAVQYAPYGDSVFVICSLKDPAGNGYLGVKEQTVILGKTRGDQVEILEGLHVGDEIATSGLFKLHEGGAIKVENSVLPGNNPTPKPNDS